MLSQRATDATSAFTRRDVTRTAIRAGLLVAALTAIFALDLLPQPLEIQVGDVATADIVAPRTQSYVSQIETQAAKDEASKGILPVYDYSTENALRIANVQQAAFGRTERLPTSGADPDHLDHPQDHSQPTHPAPAEGSSPSWKHARSFPRPPRILEVP